MTVLLYTRKSLNTFHWKVIERRLRYGVAHRQYQQWLLMLSDGVYLLIVKYQTFNILLISAQYGPIL